MAHAATAARSDADAPLSDFARSVLDGLTRHPKQLTPTWFYDAVGVHLFNAITALPEYYPTSAELVLLDEHRDDLRRMLPSGAVVVEPGAGAAVKSERLLRALDRPRAFVPIEISRDYVAAAENLLAHCPGVSIHPVIGDFTGPFSLPTDLSAGPRILFFPGSTIGNMEPPAARALLRHLWDSVDPDVLLLGVDLRKDPSRLIAAYDDPTGVTAAFNKNILARINRELRSNLPLQAFDHQARWNAQESRIEMHLLCTRDFTADVLGHKISFESGETIHTENCYKFTRDDLEVLARHLDLSMQSFWTGQAGDFALASFAR